MGHVEYLLVLAGCLLITTPLEVCGARVYRRPVRLARAILPVAAVLLIWDGIAIACSVWSYDPMLITGLHLAFGIPLEEFLFFLVIPVCSVLTYEAVRGLLGSRPAARRRVRKESV